MHPFTLHLISTFSTHSHLQIFVADEKTGTGLLLLFSFVFPLAHNRAPGWEKSSRFVECEVKWSAIWLRPRPSLFLPAHWHSTTHTAIYWRQLKFSFIHLFIYLFILCHRPNNLLIPHWTFGWEVTRTNMHYITLFLWRIVPDRQSCPVPS